MRRFIVIAAVVLVSMTLGAGNVFAKELKIGYVDILEVFNEFEKTKIYDEALEVKKSGLEKDLEVKEKEIEQIQKKMDLLKDEEKAKEEKKIEAQIGEYRELKRKAYIDVRKERDEKMKEIFEDVSKIINDYAKKNNFDLILDRSAVHYGDKLMDLTSEILRIANQEYSSKKK